MAKELPYFKFFVSEWNDGDATLEDYEVQGLFINICSYYWSNECELKFTKVRKKFRDAKPSSFDVLIESKILKVDDEDNLSISFLNEQQEDRASQRVKNQNNGSKGGRPKKKKETEEKPSGLLNESELEAKQKAIREEKKREDKIKEDLYLSIWENFPYKPEFKKVLNLFEEKFRPKTPTQKIDWLDVFEKSVRLDKYEPEKIVELIAWAREDDFWKSNLMSLASLRNKGKGKIKKIDSINAKFSSGTNSSEKKSEPRESEEPKDFSKTSFH